ncbi:MAG: ABC-type uncharacterized transport system permease subunit [Arenicella sp.]|jgi:ABC-type uncharacterized transport system permease subunit
MYGIATVLVALFLRSVKDSNTDLDGGKVTASFIIAAIGAACHIAYALEISIVGKSLNASLSSMTVLMSGLLVVLFLLGGLIMPIRRLGILVFPLTMASIVFAYLWGSQVTPLDNHSVAFSSHIVFSLLAYCLLAIASIQALLYSYQERQIKHRTNPAMLMALPPLQTMEQLLFRLVGFGFVVLCFTVVSGAIFSQELFGYAFVFKHHTILALMGWLVFAILLFKRVKHGLRGSAAVIWTISGFLLIQLGYFGTKIVSEILSLQ